MITLAALVATFIALYAGYALLYGDEDRADFARSAEEWWRLADRARADGFERVAESHERTAIRHALKACGHEVSGV